MSLRRVALRIGITVSLLAAVTCGSLGLWASRAELRCADHLVIRGHPFLAWHEGRDLRFSIYGFEPWPKNLPPDILTGPYWRFDPAFEISLWKPFACSLLLPARYLAVDAKTLFTIATRFRNSPGGPASDITSRCCGRARVANSILF